MFGLKKKKKKPFFEFDLQKDLNKDAKKQKKLAKETEDKIHALKNAIREGADRAVFDKLGVLLHGYTSLLKVVNDPNRK